MNFPNPPCPTENLPEPFYSAVVHVCRSTDAPPEVVIPDAIAVTSTIMQRAYEVRGASGIVMPTTVNTLSLVPTAVGKGESYRSFFDGPWDVQTNGTLQPVPAATVDDLLLQDISPSPLMSLLAGYRNSASIQLEDGYSFLDGPLMQRSFISKLTQAWSGHASLKFNRHHGNKEAFEPCLQIGLRIQPQLFYDFIKRNKSLSRHLGLWPRFLVFCYDTARFPVMKRYETISASKGSLLPLLERLQAMLPAADFQATTNQPARKVLQMDTYANAQLREIAYYVKRQMNAEFHDIQDAAGRAAENTLRLAANFHLVCQGEGPISREMIECAWVFVEWSLAQFRNVFVYASQPPPKPLKLKPMSKVKLLNHERRVNADMQFVLDSIAARSANFAGGRVPLPDVALLTGFARSRFLRTLGWLITNRLVEIDGEGNSETIRDVSFRYRDFPAHFTRLL